MDQIVLYTHLQHHNNTIINRPRKTSLTKYVPHPLLQGFEKGYSRFVCERELEIKHNCNILTPTLMAINVVFLVLLMLNRRPWGPLCWVLDFFTASYQQLLWSPNSIRIPKGPLGRVWLSLPHLIYNSNCNCLLTSVLTELYNSSTPTRSLEWHDWSSSSGNNCHAVQRSLSSGASVYESIMGIFLYLVPFRQPISTHAISSHNCH